MKSPFTGGNATKKSKTETFSFRGENYTVTRFYFECDETGKIFSNAEVDDKVMEDLYSQYRDRHGIPSPTQLKGLREKYGLSAHTMSKIAGMGINQYGLYENGEMPTIVIGQKLSTLFEKDSLLKSIDKARVKLGKDFEKTREKVESYTEPQSFKLAKVYYPQFDELVPLIYPSVAYPIRKPRWATCQ